MPENFSKIKVLHVIIGLEIGGVEVLLTRLLPQIDPFKYDITVCALKKWNKIADSLSEKGIKVVALEGSGKFSLGVLLKLFNLVHNRRYDIVQSHLYFANFASALVLLIHKLFFRSAKSPLFIVTSHEMGDWQNWFHNLGEKFYYLLADRMVCCSLAVRALKMSLHGFSGDKCEVIHNGISLPENPVNGIASGNLLEIRKSLGWNDSSIYLMATVGRLDNRTKGFNYLIQAISLIQKDINCRLLILGSGPDFKTLSDLITELGLKDRVKIAQNLDPSKVISCVDLFVLPSNNEGFGIVLLEAMVAAKPIVATFVGGIPEVVLNGETGILVWPRAPALLARAIIHMKEHPQEASQMAHNGRKRLSEKFSLELMVKKTEALYESLLRERTPCAE